MPSHLDIAQDLYEALGRADVGRLYELLHPDFVGHVSEGMPPGVRGTHVGPKAMLEEAWAPIARRFAVRPVPDRFVPCEDGAMLVLGRYVGEPPDGDGAFTAAFAHVLAFRDGRIGELRQITDTQRWAEAASAQKLAVVRRMFDAVERRDAEALFDTYAEDIRIDEPGSLPYGGVYHGHDGGMRHGVGYVETWDAIQTEDDRNQEAVFLDAGDRVVVLWRQKATIADGRHLDSPVVDLVEVRDGRATSLRMFHSDTAAVLEFLGSVTA